MKTSNANSTNANDPLRRTSAACAALALVALIGVGGNPVACKAETPLATVSAGRDLQGVQVLTRGPVHEAFAGMVVFNPEPGIIVVEAPPALIEEIPPGERPEGDNVTWIPGYWAWDEEPANFLWVSGTWRALPPGRQWIAGYWLETTQGYQWTSGYWADAEARETVYLAPPPVTVEAGPNVAAPSADHRWTPGNWMWSQDRYAWGPGYWARGRADWDWTPSHYVWTPRGYVFVTGYWDYPIQRRGALFAPVYFDSGVYARSGHYYTPSVVINLAVFAEHLFLRPRYSHYYFGDYYAPRYQQSGYLSAYVYQSSRYGYDPIYSHQRWEHRQDRGWDNRMASSFQYRRDHESARPPRTWDAQRARAGMPGVEQNRMSMGMPFDEVSSRKDGRVRYQAVTAEERQQLAQRGQDMGRFRDQRRTLEAKGVDPAARRPGELMAPTRVEQAISPIVAKRGSELGKGRTPPPAPRAPRLETTTLPKVAPTERQPRVDPRQPAATPPERQDRPDPRQPAATPPERQGRPNPRQPAATPPERQGRPDPRQPAATPPERQGRPDPRQPAATPPERQGRPDPRQPAATPPERKAQPAPSRPAAAPPERKAKPAPSRPAAAPPERKAKPAPSQPAATPPERKARPAPSRPAAAPPERDRGAGQTDAKDRKSQGKK